MKPPLNRRFRSPQTERPNERGVTMVLVAVAMVAMIAMAALSIDLVTLYLAREEAQRSADAAALAAARVISISGVTGDPNNIQGSLPAAPWGTVCTLATQLAQTVGNQNSVARTVATSVVVTYLYNGASTDCTAPNTGFAVNPEVQVQVTRQSLPAFFSRIWGNTSNSVSATAVAEVYNPSGSSILASGMVPVNPRCVKPWILPNIDPGNTVGGPQPFFLPDGSLKNAGITLNSTRNGPVPDGDIGESLNMTTCNNASCGLLTGAPPAGSYIPALINASSTAVPSCGNADDYQEAIAGCDQSTPYQCGTVNGSRADLTITPSGLSGDSAVATQCLIHQAGGNDTLDTSVYPFQMSAGAGNPVLTSGIVSSSSSIVTIPVYDSSAPLTGGLQPAITIIGFLQVFIDGVDGLGNINLHILNVAGCGNAAVNTAVNGSSPVPVRLITSP
jgi:Flp pilus assembly protein TadG